MPQAGRTPPPDPPGQQGIPSNLTGQVPPGYDPAYGGVPPVPNPIASQWQAIGGDIAGLPDLFNLAGAYNLFNYNQRMGQVSGTPGFSNVEQLLGGQLPQDVISQIQQASAERSGAAGLPVTSPNANAAYLRALGLSSLDAQKLGQSEYGNLLGLFPQAAPFDLSSFLVTPEQQQAANLAANQAAAAPNPAQAAKAELDALLKAIEAGKSGVPGAGGVPSITPPSSVAGSLTAPAPGSAMVTGPGQTINRGGTTTTTAPPVTPFNYPGQQQGNAWYSNLVYPGAPLAPQQPSIIDQMTQVLGGQGPSTGNPWPGGGQVNPADLIAQWWHASPDKQWEALSGINWAAPADFSNQPLPVNQGAVTGQGFYAGGLSGAPPITSGGGFYAGDSSGAPPDPGFLASLTPDEVEQLFNQMYPPEDATTAGGSNMFDNMSGDEIEQLFNYMYPDESGVGYDPNMYDPTLYTMPYEDTGYYG